MVRFSDMLGGNDDSHGTRAPAAAPPRAAAPDPIPDIEPDIEPEPADDDSSATESAQEVLDRLKQFATSARTPDEPEASDVVADADAALTPVGDDLLPHPKGDTRKRRRK